MPEKDGVTEALRIVTEAEKRNVVLRIVGGIAFRLRSPSSSTSNLKRTYADIDMIGRSDQSKQIKSLFKDLGYEPRERFNQMNGRVRLIFNDLENNRRIDIFLNIFEMCHKFDFTDRLQVDKVTLPLADLLLTKLQVIEITEREYKDVLALLCDNEIGDKDDSTMINGKYIAQLCASDWGIYKTVTMNLERIKRAQDEYSFSKNQAALIESRINSLTKMIEDAPKSMKWRARARIGEKVKWYQLPEADQKVIDSRPFASDVK